MTRGTVLASTVSVLVAAWMAALAASECIAADASASRSTAAVSLRAAAVANYQGLWWNALEPGWGINFAHQGDTIFASWFTYDIDGSPLWMVMAAPKSAADVYDGTLYRAVGPPFFANPFDASKVVGTLVGTGKLTFTDDRNATFTYTIGGVTQSKAITRQVFATPEPGCSWSAQADLAGASNYQDLWWKEPAGSESGWGINLTHQGATIFATWYTYDGYGKPWWVTTAASRVAPQVYSGTVFTAQSGPAYNAASFDPAKVKPLEVGTATFTFTDGAHGRVDATILDTRIRRPIVRQSFGPPGSGTVCTPTEVITSCQVSVTSGFSGDLNATYDTGSGAAGGGGGGGGGGDGGAGAGAGEGKVLGGLMTVTRLSDGAALGAAVTDSQNGLVTIKSCEADWPVLVTLAGQPGARYYDEATNQFSDFGSGKVLHALVDQFDENVGVSPLTEAAYRYALNNIAASAKAIAEGKLPLRVMDSTVGLTTAQVREANAVVLDEINRILPAESQLATLKSLPTPVDSASPATAFPNNRYGIAATVLGGMAQLGKAYVPSTGSPALAAGEQLALDLTDGRIDGFQLNGSPAAASGAPVAYDAVRFPLALNVGANAVAAKFGATTTFAQATPIAELTGMGVLSDVNVCTTGGDLSALLKDGSLAVARSTCGATSPSSTLSNFATQVRLVEGSGDGVVPRTFFVKTDGTMWAWGQAACGLLGNGETEAVYHSTPLQLSGINDVTAIAVGSYFALARDSSGAVYSWGINYLGELGMGPGTSAPGSIVCRNDFTSDDFRYEAAVSRPTRVTALTDVVAVAADAVTGFALDRSGNVFQWGLIPTGYNFNAPKPYYGEYAPQPFPAKVKGLPPTIALAVSYYMKMALAADGRVWGWGPNVNGNFGDGTLALHLDPTLVPGLPAVAEIAASGTSPFVALLHDGTIRYWGGCCSGPIKMTPTAPVPGNTPFHSTARGNYLGTLPPIRHVKGNGGKVLLYGVDGTLFWFPRENTEDVFVVVDAGVFTP